MRALLVQWLMVYGGIPNSWLCLLSMRNAKWTSLLSLISSCIIFNIFEQICNQLTHTNLEFDQLFKMNVESNRNLETDESAPQHSKLKLKRSQTYISVDKLNEVEHEDCLLSRLLCLHHIRTAVTYLCSVDKNNIIRYNSEYQRFISTTKLRDVAVAHAGKEDELNILTQAFKLQSIPILLILILSMAAAAASVVVIYYQQKLAKYIIMLTPDEQYKWFGIIVGCIVIRFLVFNYLAALTNNVAINIKVGLENLFMRAIFFLDHKQEELSMHRMRFLAIESLIEGITFVPYALVAFFTIVGVVVLVFNMNGNYGFVYFGIVLFCFIVHIILLVLVQQRLRANEKQKEQASEESKWIFRSLIPLIFDRISERIVARLLKVKKESLSCDRFYNGCYSVSQFFADASTVVPIMIYYGLNYVRTKDMNIMNTYLTAAYLGMLYFPFKIFVFGSYSIVRGFEQYSTMIDTFRAHLRQRNMRDLHVIGHHRDPQIHAYPDNLGDCYNYQYDEQAQPQLPPEAPLVPSRSNTFIELAAQPGEAVMAYFDTGSRQQVERYIKELVNGLPFDKTVATINEDYLILPESFQQNVIFYSPYDEERFHRVLRLVELDYFIPQLQAIANTRLNYRIAKFYPWHECRLELARALYTSVDYLFIHKHILLEDEPLLRAVLDFRRQEGKVTFVANSCYLEQFALADRVILFEGANREAGTYRELREKEGSILNKIAKQLRREGIKPIKSEQVSNLHQNFLAVVAKQAKPIELSRFVYFQFFNFAHWGGCIVVFLAMLSPVGFKVYVNYLIGQSTKTVIYPDIITFGVLFVCCTLLRGLVLSFYFRTASAGLFERILTSHRRLNGDQLLSVLKEKDDHIEDDFRKVDSNLVICFELGITVMLEVVGALIIVIIGQPIILAMAVPLLVLLIATNLLYNRMDRGLLVLRSHYEDQLKTFINHCTTRATALFRYGQYQGVQTRFNELHRLHVMFACNEAWALSGMRMIGEIFLIIGVTVFLVIMIETQSHKITNLAMVTYGVSLFVNMNFTFRFNIKTFSIIETQMLALTKCVNFYKNVEEEAHAGAQGGQDAQGEVQIDEVSSVEFRNVNIEFGSNKCERINLRLSKGDRVAVSADSRTLATLPFYLLQRKAFSSDHVSGDILVNGTLTPRFTITGLFYIHSKPLLPYCATVLQICQKWNPDLTREECARRLDEFFKETGLTQLFSLQDRASSMHLGLQQILSVFRVVKLENCSVLVMVSAFDYLDVLTRVRIEKYLIAQRIPILISINNNPEIIPLYNRHLSFSEGAFHEQSTQPAGRQKQE